MQIRSQCPKCGHVELLDKQAADRRIRCAHCRHLYSVPNLDHMPRATQIIEQSRSQLFVDEEGNMFA